MTCNNGAAQEVVRVPVRLKLSSRLSSLATVCAFVEGACKALAPKLGPNDVRNLQLAVNEACSNIIRHAYGNDGTCEFWLRAAAGDAWLEFTTVDQGKTAGDLFVNGAAEPHDDREPAEGGYGIMLIRKVFDEIRYFHDPKRGNVLVMKKLFHSMADLLGNNDGRA